MYFHISDLIPIAILVGSAVLCLLGFLKAKKLPPKIICILTGLFFLVGIPLMYFVRYTALKHDYKSKHGILVRQGKLNKCEKADIEKWTDELIELWKKHYKEGIINKTWKERVLICLDDYKISLMGKYVHGYANVGRAVIGWDAKVGLPYARSAFKHEMSHHILAINGIFWDEAFHHKIFKEKGFEGASGSVRH